MTITAHPLDYALEEVSERRCFGFLCHFAGERKYERY